MKVFVIIKSYLHNEHGTDLNMVSKGDSICIKTLLYFFYFIELYIWANILRPSHFLLKTKGLNYGFNKVSHLVTRLFLFVYNQETSLNQVDETF